MPVAGCPEGTAGRQAPATFSVEFPLLRGPQRKIEPIDQNPSPTQHIVRELVPSVNMKLPTGQNFFVKRVLS